MIKKSLCLNRRFILYLQALLCLSMSVYAQETTNEAAFNYESELNRSVPIPNSPEAEAFTQYGNTPVNMYAGSPEIGIPIYTHQGRELNLPVNLSYDASGVKVEQLATSAGLGWNLAVGGRISRVANGNPDDYIQSGITPYVSFWNNDIRDKMLKYYDESTSFATRDSIVMYFDFMNSISINEIDTQPDYYSLNAIGINDYIAFDVETRQAYALNNPHIKVDFITTPASANGMRSITKWTVTGADGTKYYFDEAEITDFDGDDMNQQYATFKTYNSSWVLTKVESANRKDTYIFNYTKLAPWSQNFSVSGYSAYTYTIDENTPANVPSPPFVTSSVPFIRIEQQRLDNILHNGKEIVSIAYENRYDIGASDAIDAITVKNGTTQDYKTYDFLTSYFGINDNQSPSGQQASNIRLKLNGIDIRSNTNDLYQKYRFEYFSPDQVPSVVSKAQDYMGYYNGKGSNGVLFPEVTVGQHTFGGADRSINFSDAIKGTLSRIYYPTGGYTDFEFEPHTTPAEISDVDENTHTQVYASQLLVGGIDNNISCTDADSFCECNSGWCNDEYGPGQSPNFTNTSFDVQEAGNYTLKYIETNSNGGNVPSGGTGMKAYAFKVSNNTNCGPAPILDTDQILNPSGNGNLLIDSADVVFSKYDDQYQLDVDGEMSVYLTPGCYQILLVNPNNQITQFLQVSRVETTIDSPGELADVQRAGIRIKTIKNYTNANELATEKEYVYKVARTSTADSSGNIIFNPQFYTINNGISLGGLNGCEIIDATSISVVGSSSGGSQPHVAYSRVYEILKKGTTPEDNGGYTRHDFYIDQNTGLHSSGVPPNVSSYRPSLAVGQQIGSAVFDASYTALQEISSELATNSSSYKYFGSFGLYVINKPEKNFDLLISKPYLGGYTYDFQQKQYGLFSTGAGDGSTACAYVYPDRPLDWHLHIRNYVPSFELRSSAVQGAVGGMISQTSTQFFGNMSEGKKLQTVDTFEYDNNIGHLLRKKTTTLEDDEQITQQYVYSLELTDPVYLQMQTRNQLQMPVEITTTSDNAINTRKSNYTAVGNGFYPTSIEIANNLIDPVTGIQSSHPEEGRIYFEYYTNGNIKESYQLDISNSTTPSATEKINKVSYIWGYDNRYPIVKVANASHSEIASYVSSLVSLAQADNDRTLGYQGNEGALRQALDAMRNNPSLSHTQISTYTYDPLIGVTSMTDPRGYTMYYEYDNLHRLKYVKDADGNILTENEYNYRFNN
ncbi:YD repeat-containing protein [Dokdonia pacifica]|uniref:YD repeat-containing protein n=2 Tax=Dokdonia pacifica TaxID=1627892 RepID=A0A239DY38_9FLAO|nr:YD repeat-containing protein [Dokdonia pacifica]